MSVATPPQEPDFGLPAEFDPACYQARYGDARGLSVGELERQFRSHLAGEGRNGSCVASRSDFLRLIPTHGDVLEIGPFANPLLRGPRVKYFDVLATDALRARAKVHGLDPGNCPHIDFVSPAGDLDVVNERFDAVVSSHVIEHQPDLVRHLRAVARVLRDDGLYFLAVPDKRFCFDHFIAESSIAEVISAHARGIRVHDAHSVIEHRALTTHNDPARHWRGDHGVPAWEQNPGVLLEAAELVLGSDGAYLDVHAWQFVPASFASIVRALFDLRLIALQPLRVYPTSPGSNEFYAVLRNIGRECIELRGEPVGDDFDPEQYLLANPDVANAGVDPRQHYLMFGRREGRRLKP
jgi:SAM-dependent methyltransferase